MTEIKNIGRVLTLGDSHGGFRAVKQVMERSNFDRNTDQLICLGDVSDGWSETAELVQYLIELEEECTVKPVFIRGNHDKWAEQWLTLGACDMIWREQGGKATMESYIRTGYLTEEKHREFYRNMVNYYIDDKNRGFVHGGFHSKHGLGHDTYDSDYYWDRDLWNLAFLNHSTLESATTETIARMYKHSEVYIGHTSTTNWKCKPYYPEFTNPHQAANAPITVPMRRCNVWNMDTGGGWGGKLTIMDVDSKEYWQSDLVSDLYSNELGRN